MNRCHIHSNTLFSKLDSSDLLDLLVEIENTLIEFRPDLSYDNPNITFGIEIEYEDVKKIIVSKFIKNKHKSWDSIGDDSLKSGGEIVSPVLTGNDCQWDVLDDICHFLKFRNADTSNSAGEHIHVGRQILTTKDELILFVKLYILSEHILFRFGYGDKISSRAKLLKYASPTALELYENLDKLNSCNSLEEMYILLEKIPRYSALNFSNINSVSDKKTIECRFLNATSNKVIIQNNINTILNMFAAPSKGIIDIELIDYYINNIVINELEYNYKYNEICLEDALLFVDQIFNCDIDKLYFLKQYIKGYQNNFGMKNAVYAKRLTK